MRIRLLAAVLALVSVAAMAVGWVDQSRPLPGEYVGLSAQRLSRPLPGEYVGLSTQRLPVRLTVAADRKTLAMDVSWCGEPCEQIGRVISKSVTIADDGSFSWEDRRGYVNSGYEESNHLRLQGRRDGDNALTGTWRVDSTGVSEDDGPFQTSTGDLSFRVSRGGSVRQPPPHTDPSGNLVIPLDWSPKHVAVGERRAWVLSETFGGLHLEPGVRVTGTNRKRVFVSEIDPRTGAIGRRTDIKDRAGVAVQSFGGIVAGEGAIWLPSLYRDPVQVLARVDARTRRVLLLPRKPKVSVVSGDGFAVGAGGLWEVDSGRPGSHRLLFRSDPRSGRTVRRIRLPYRSPGPKCRHNLNAPPPPQLITISAGRVWVTSRTDSFCGRLSQIDAQTNRVTRAIALQHSYYALAAAPGGVWGVTRRGSRYERGRRVQYPAALHRIGLRDGRPAAVTPLPDGEVRGLAVSREAVWISQTDGQRGGILLRVSRATGRVSTALKFQTTPSNVAIGEGAVWVIDTTARTLIRIPL